jgi:hypothetical protein
MIFNKLLTGEVSAGWGRNKHTNSSASGAAPEAGLEEQTPEELQAVQASVRVGLASKHRAEHLEASNRAWVGLASMAASVVASEAKQGVELVGHLRLQEGRP